MLAAPVATTAAPFDMGAGAWSLAPVGAAVAGVRVASSWLVRSTTPRGAAAVVWVAEPVRALRSERVESRTETPVVT
jgi:hypothetical protein